MEQTNLPAKETLYRIFDLLFECQDILDRKTSSCYIDENIYERYAQYIADNWD